MTDEELMYRINQEFIAYACKNMSFHIEADFPKGKEALGIIEEARQRLHALLDDEHRFRYVGFRSELHKVGDVQ